MCWSQDPNKRPTFDDIVEILEENSQFITKDVDLLKYRKYIKYFKEEGSVSFDLSDRIHIEIKEEESYKLLIKANTIELSQFQKLGKIGERSFGRVYITKSISLLHDNSLNFPL